MKLLVATNNLHKLEEYRSLLEGLPLTLRSLRDEGIEMEVEENGSTFEENASIKARTYASLSGLLTMADDSGLEVASLAGDPGVYSSRYAGPGASDRQRTEYLLAKMKGLPWKQRKARFRCVIAIAQPGHDLRLCEGRCDGIIALEPRGEHGFGYDPVFYLPDLGVTMAELPSSRKNEISHRALAARQARKI
ncbi:MAG: RdgB/HAM1 family non-canonical purine NTP pyrophosphatase, partial [Dehalococcoidia bacterium]|nr:RdgB/HAM1 family non-canonical purine NTP pyrophosphatase [Dehalococcoidia bacterium]